MSGDSSQGSKSLIGQVAQAPQYFSESIEELKKINRPTKAETMQATLAAIVIITFTSLVLFFLDVIVARLMESVLG